MRPGAPGRELSDWINKGARAGLPEIKPTPVAIAPALGQNDRRNSRRIAVPPNEIIRRPVVTRNPNAGSSAQLGAPRERRLISPRNPGAITQSPALIERGSDRGADRRPGANAGSQTGADSGGERQSPKIRVGLPAPSEKVNDDGSAHPRKQTREGAPAVERPAKKSEDSADGTRPERRHPQPEPSATPVPKDSNPSGNRQNGNETRSRERRQPNSDPKPNEDTRQRGEKPDRPRDSGASAPRAEPRQERPNSEARQERHQEKQERQKQEEQRKKP